MLCVLRQCIGKRRHGKCKSNTRCSNCRRDMVEFSFHGYPFPVGEISERRKVGARTLSSLYARFPVLQLTLCFVFAQAIGLLNPASELVTFTCNLIKVIVSKFAPLFFHFALELFPVTFYAVPIHLELLSLMVRI